MLLVIDDEESIRDVMPCMLSCIGYTGVITVAESAEEGATYIGASRLEGVLSDFMLPGMTGVQFAERLRREAHVCPIVLMSGGGLTTHTIAGLIESGVLSAFIHKPFTLEELQATAIKVGLIGGEHAV